MREVLQTQFYKDLTKKTSFLAGCSWFKFNNLVVELGVAMTFYANEPKSVKLKLRNFCGLISTFLEVTGEKLAGESF